MNGDIKYTDNELLTGIKSQNSKPLKFIIKEYFPSIRQMVLLNNGSELDADDVFQDSLIILYRKVRADNFQLSSSLKTYFYSICRHKWFKELGRREKLAIITDEEEDIIDIEDNSIEEEIQQEERERIYREKFEELSEDCKRILKMYVSGISISEITKIMGYSSEQHTRNRRFKCKEALIQKIKKTKPKNELGYENYRAD